MLLFDNQPNHLNASPQLANDNKAFRSSKSTVNQISTLFNSQENLSKALRMPYNWQATISALKKPFYKGNHVQELAAATDYLSLQRVVHEEFAKG